LQARDDAASEITYADVIDTMKAIYEHPDPGRALAVEQ